MSAAVNPAAVRDLLHDLRNPDPATTVYAVVEFLRASVIPRLEAMLEGEPTESQGEGAAIAREWREAKAALDATIPEKRSEKTDTAEDRLARAESAVLAYRGLDCADVIRIQAEQSQEVLTDEANAEGRELDAIEQALIANSFALASLIAQQR